MCVDPETLADGYRIVERLNIYDEDCVRPPQDSELSFDPECLLITNEHRHVLLVDPVLIIIAETLDDQIESAGAIMHAGGGRLFMVLNGENVRGVLGEEI